MNTITVDKAKLMETLKTNRDAHRDKFLQAQKKYREKVVEELDKRLEMARAGQKPSLNFNLVEPVEYTESYDTAIAMLEWEQGDTIDLEEHDFKQYVLDQWGWHKMFAANSLSYLGD